MGSSHAPTNAAEMTPGGRKQGPLTTGMSGAWLDTALKLAEVVVH